MNLPGISYRRVAEDDLPAFLDFLRKTGGPLEIDFTGPFEIESVDDLKPIISDDGMLDLVLLGGMEVGYLHIFDIDDSPHCANVNFHFCNEMPHDDKLRSQVLQKWLDDVRDEYALSRIQGVILESQGFQKRVLETSGFSKEGVLKEHFLGEELSPEQ